MPRYKKQEECGNTMSKYFQFSRERRGRHKGLSLQDLKEAPKAELHSVVQELKDLKSEYRTMGVQIKQLEGRLTHFGNIVVQLKSDISTTSSNVIALERSPEWWLPLSYCEMTMVRLLKV